MHTLSVSLNKIGDLRYYDGDLQSARSYYAKSLDVRRNAVKEHTYLSSQVSNYFVGLGSPLLSCFEELTHACMHA